MSTELLLSLTTIGVSILALYISNKTARIHNKIVLFDKRMACYNDLRLHFSTRDFLSLAEANLIGADIKSGNEYEGNLHHLFSRTRLLFSDMIWDLTAEVEELHKRVLQKNYWINVYFSLLDDDVDGLMVKERVKEYIEFEMHDLELHDTAEMKEVFQGFCEEHAVEFEHAEDGTLELDYCDLKSRRDQMYQEILAKEKALAEWIESEMRIKTR